MRLLLALASLFCLKVQAADMFLIGDSHSVLDFGATLEKELQLQRYAVSAAEAADWNLPVLCPDLTTCRLKWSYAIPIKGKIDGLIPGDFGGIDSLLKKYVGATVIVALGTNDANIHCHQPAAESMKAIKKLLGKIETRECYWVGPPVYLDGLVIEKCGKDYDPFVSTLKKTVEASRCKFIDSRQIKNPATGKPVVADHPDKIHFEAPLGTVWGQAVSAEIRRLRGISKR